MVGVVGQSTRVSGSNPYYEIVLVCLLHEFTPRRNAPCLSSFRQQNGAHGN